MNNSDDIINNITVLQTTVMVGCGVMKQLMDEEILPTELNNESVGFELMASIFITNMDILGENT